MTKIKAPAKKPEDYPKEIHELAIKEIELLASKSYDQDSTLRFAKAAKSWCEKGSQEWLVWDLVALLASDS